MLYGAVVKAQDLGELVEIIRPLLECGYDLYPVLTSLLAKYKKRQTLT